MDKRFTIASLLILTSLCMTACATGVTHVKLYDPLTYAPSQEVGRSTAHADVPKSRDTTHEKVTVAIGKIRDTRPDIASIGVKKNAYGIAMGKVDVEKSVIFLDVFKSNLIKCFVQSGYAAISLKEFEGSIQEEKDKTKAVMEADIQTFWVEFMPGLFVVDAASNVIFEVRLVDPQTNREIWSEIFRGKGLVSGPIVTKAMFEKSMNIAYADAMRSLYTTISDEKMQRELIH